MSREKFEQLIAEEAFLEWVEFRGELYGTQKQTFLETMQSGHDVIWKIEMKGIKNMREKIKKLMPRSVFVFLTGLTVEVLHDRVLKAEGEENMEKRWNESLVVWEMKQYQDCEYMVINEDNKLEKAIADVQAIVEAKRCELMVEESELVK
jgi:guanylate kinase